jgi:Double-GTPase 1
MLIGGPDSGKTNFIGRLWVALDNKEGTLHALEQPEDLSFVLGITEHLCAGNFAPRSELSEDRRDFEILVAHKDGGPNTSVLVPDVSGELWRKAIIEREIDPAWMSELKASNSAIVFVRVDSDQDVRPLDWVNSKRLLAKLGAEEEQGLPTQIMLCEFLRLLESSLAYCKDVGTPRVSVIVSAWDRVDSERFEQGPASYLEREYPLFAGKLKNSEYLNIQVFGLSVVGGDLTSDVIYKTEFLDRGISGQGWVAVQRDGVWVKDPDVALPLVWAMGL